MARPIRHVHVSTRFARAFKRLDPQARQQAVEAERLFRADAFDPRLRTHPLKGVLEGLWAFSVTNRLRVLFEFLRVDTVLFIDIGSHDIYR